MGSVVTKRVAANLDSITVEKLWITAEMAIIWLEQNNKSNRPMTMSIVKRYRDAILEGRWVPTPDTIGFDDKGNLLSGQHRLMGLVLAEKMRVEDPDYVKNEYGIDQPISMPAVITRGYLATHADVIDIGKTRTGADVLARRHLFGVDRSDAENKRLHKELAVAARLCWTRINGKTVKGSGVFQHHELKPFVTEHKDLVDCITEIRDLDFGDKNDRLICNYLTVGYASALLYLMKSHNAEKAEEFWTLFASGALDTEHPISRLKSFLLDQRAAGTVDRDHVVNAVIKSFLFFMKGTEKVPKQAVKPKKSERPVIPESLDASPEEQDLEPAGTEEAEETPAETEKPARPSRKRKPSETTEGTEEAVG